LHPASLQHCRYIAGVFKARFSSPPNLPPSPRDRDGCSIVQVRVTPPRTEMILLATRALNGQAVVQKRFGFSGGSVELCSEKVAMRHLCTIAPAELLHYKHLEGLAVSRRGLLAPGMRHLTASSGSVPIKW
uniref:Uncharacterized protein n=1 Tax=Crocodylus porosus TaxID=8502 RepID=A0A7M4G0M0_CROPO